ncbi:MAG TPA: hypothetical protein PKN48_10240 [Bacteroidales bacterium]|mgnify:CR=1 FL=1|nr:hypothetical protein [Bacteroidales bacterium]
MAKIAGIQIEKDGKGRPVYARINLKKHKDAIIYLQEKGVIETEPEINEADYISSEEFWKNVLDHVEKKNKEYFSK